MDEKQIISQLKYLRKVKPAKDWALLVKKDLLFEPMELKEKPAGEPFFAFFARAKLSFAKPAFVISSALVVGFAILGTLAYFGLQKNTYNLQAFVDKVSFQTEESKVALASLQDVQNKIDEVRTVLTSLKTDKDSKKVLMAAEVIKATAKNSQQAIAKMQSSNADVSKQVMASLNKIKDSSLDLEKTSADLQIEMFKSYLADLKTKTLSPDDEERLKKAEEYFNNGQTENAIVLLMKIGENASQ